MADLFKINKIRIIKIPSGEAPLWVRKAWVGLKIPTYKNLNCEMKTNAHESVLSGKKALPAKVYYVLAKDAFESLTSIKALEWWENCCPRLFEDGILLSFEKSECELV